MVALFLNSNSERRSITVKGYCLPSSDMQFLKELAKRMGWIAYKVKSNSKMSELDKAILDVKEGNVKNFDTLKNMMNYLEA